MISSALPKRSLSTRFTTNPYAASSLPTIGGIMFGCDISSMSAQLSIPYYLEQFGHPDSNLQGGITASMPAGWPKEGEMYGRGGRWTVTGGGGNAA
ncbi:hypothetical protein JCM10213_005418 [Rhodosporidiobolus nylandii]